MDPSWVITLLEDGGELSNSRFVEALDQQLKVWSRSDDSLGEHWWALDSFDGRPSHDLDEFAATLQRFIRDPTSSDRGGE
ncbi:MAG TPA: hypothetical protein VD861_22140, partial [Pyrinomonadaceae bacterium]|nr:hypothetical protein [Pyrinomonadaceae bacterium]